MNHNEIKAKILESLKEAQIIEQVDEGEFFALHYQAGEKHGYVAILGTGVLGKDLSQIQGKAKTLAEWIQDRRDAWRKRWSACNEG